ncbi:MAG: 4-(cytidine 5'-diphospho)-2-C-methyl-D-erythritol kinase [Dehalococcoidales bacterium]|nr:MAG: 4-(cytidine 5'-diphospho)-2-C-methyl-D-erythritol kinase [Dehalococcoidales bacterium]
MLMVKAPAKINLTLEVLVRREDGYHQICSVIQAISLSDELYFQSAEGIEFSSSSAEWVAEKSLVNRATGLLKIATGCSRGALIEVNKRIPLVSGLGGDSSDAAAVLRGLNRLWELNLSRDELLELARQIGSDVAFFLYGGTALVEGRGEVVTPLPPLPHRWVVLVVPPVSRMPDKTKQLYQSLSPGHYTDGRTTRRMVDAIEKGEAVTPAMLYNTFENVALTRFEGLDSIWERVAAAGAGDIRLAGSGPALFILFEDKSRTEELDNRLQQQGLESYLAETVNAVSEIA